MGKHSSIRRGSWRDAARIVTKSNLALGAVLAVLSWPYDKIALMPAYGMDPGWSAALEMVAHQRLPFGTHAVFAYGPLGFLAVWPVYFTWPAIVGFLFQFSLYSSVFAALIWALRRVIPIVAAIILAFVAGAISINAVAFIYSGEPEKALALALIGCIYALTRAADEPVPKRLWVALGVGVGIFCLLKISIGLGIAVALVITVACLSRGKLRALAWIAPAALATFAIGWFATGNGFANIVGYVRGDLSTIAGYGAAVSVEDPTRWYTYWYAAAVVAIVAALAVGRCWSLPRRAQVGVGLVTLFVVWQLFKEAFVRHDIYHDPIFFAVAPLFVIAFIPTRPTWKWSFAITGGVLATSVLAGALTSFPTQLTRPGTGAPDFANEVTTLVVPGDRSAEITTARALLRGTYAVPSTMIADMQGHTVDVDPWEQTLVWAYPGVRFDPLPSLQPYNAYTTSLDQQDARYLASSEAPDYFIRQQPAAFDHRNPAFEPPATQIAMECRYRQVTTDLAWQLVVRSKNRCGASRSLGTASATLDQWVKVPQARPGEAVLATFQVPLSLWWSIQNLAFKPPSVYMVVDGGAQTYRFVTGTESSLHILRPASTLGYDAEFAPQAISSLLFTVDGEGGLGGPGVRVHFYALKMAKFSR